MESNLYSKIHMLEKRKGVISISKLIFTFNYLIWLREKVFQFGILS